MKRVLLSVLCFFNLTGAVGADQTMSLIRVSGLSKADFKSMISGDYDIAKTGKDFVELVATKDAQDRLKKVGRLSVLIPDLDAYIADILKSQTPEKCYYTYASMTETLQGWAEKYNSIARLSSIGKSIEGRDIWAMKISDNPDLNEKEPAVLINGAHHAREWISVEVPMETLKQLLEGYGTDEHMTKLVDDHEIWFVPMVNPDGITFSQTKSKMWRKNRRKVDSSNYGVDPNRNYGYKWGLTGASNSPSSDTYHGKAPFSEPEITAMKELAEREHFQASLSFHSYSELILYPFAYDYNVPCEDTPIFEKWSKEMAEFNHYKPQVCTDLYPCMGVSDDWFYGANKTLAFTFELAQTFIPPVNDIAKVCKINVPATLYLIEKSGEYSITSPTGDPEIISHLDATSALNALANTGPILPRLSQEAKLRVTDHLNLAGKRVASIVTDDLLAGKTASWTKVKAHSAFSLLKPMIRTRLMFESAHGNKVPQDILNELTSSR